MTDQGQQPTPNAQKAQRLPQTRGGCLKIGLAAFSAIAIVAVIALPMLFRGLDEDMQFRLVRRFPFMSDWQFRPTPPFQSLPTLAVTEDNGYALLLTPLASATHLASTAVAVIASPTSTEIRPSATNTASATPTITPSVTPKPTDTATPTVTVTRSVTPSATPTATVSTSSPAPATLNGLSATQAEVTFTPTVPPETPTAIPTGTFTATPSATPTITPSDTPLPTSTALPTTTPSATVPPTNTHVPTQTPSAIPTATEAPTLPPVPVSYHRSEYKWVPQTWNNCGPANLTQALQPFGWQGNQATAAAFLKPNKEDKNVSPTEIVTYVGMIGKETNAKSGVAALTRAGGDLALIKRLVSQQFSVIMETGFILPEEGWMGHYLTVIGYDDNKGVLYGLDTYLGDGPDSGGVLEKYDDLDTRWQQFNRVYIVIFPKERESELLTLLGPDADPASNAQRSLETARRDAATNPNNQYAWFNLGTNYTVLGQYPQATVAFDRASRVGGGLPFRMLWYQFDPFEAYYRVGNYTNVMALVSASLKTTTYVEETYYWRGMVSAAQGRSAQALEDFNRVLKFNPNFTLAAQMRDAVTAGTFKPPTAGTRGD